MIRLTQIGALMAAVHLAPLCLASTSTLFFAEDFETDAADWRDALSGPLTHQANGGVNDSGHVTTDFAFADAGGFGAVLFRGQSGFGSSGGAFAGDWVAEGVENVSLSIRHNAPIPLSFSLRFASPFNFPGSSAVIFQPVLPNQFTELSVAIEEGNPQFVTFEGLDFNTVFSNVGNLQVTASIPSSFAVVDEALINAAAFDDSITLPQGAMLGDVYGAFNVVTTTLVDAMGDPILDMGVEQQFDAKVPVGAPIFNNSLVIDFDLDAVVITAAVPEPTTAAAAIGAVALCGVYRRRR